MNRITGSIWTIAMLSGVLWLFTGWAFIGWLCVIAFVAYIALPLPDSHAKNVVRY